MGLLSRLTGYRSARTSWMFLGALGVIAIEGCEPRIELRHDQVNGGAGAGDDRADGFTSDQGSFGGGPGSGWGGSEASVGGGTPAEPMGKGAGAAQGSGASANSPSPDEDEGEDEDVDDQGSGGTVVRERSFLPCAVELIIESRCRACHSEDGNGQEPLFDTWQQVSAEAEYILDAIEDDFMPRVLAPLTDEEKETLVLWVEGGTPSIRSTSPPSCAD